MCRRTRAYIGVCACAELAIGTSGLQATPVFPGRLKYGPPPPDFDMYSGIGHSATASNGKPIDYPAARFYHTLRPFAN